MKKILSYLFAVAIASTMMMSSCSKDGSEGPLGPKGEKGETGAQGIPGTDGNMILSGNGAPAADLGAEGDFYIDLTNSNLYGPKTASWGTALSMKGAAGSKGEKGDKGDKGVDGSQFLSGVTNPTTVGVVGDFYFNTISGQLFGPKTSAGWGSGTLLRGPKGDKGDKGDPGNANVISTGWVKLDATKWNIAGGYRSPSDLTSPYVTNSQFPIGNSDLDGIVLVYVKNLRSTGRPTDIMLLPVKDRILQNGQYFGVELRFNHSGDVNFAKYVTLNVGLQSGTWNDTYMKNTYLSSLEWKVVRIPVVVAKAHERALSKMDLKNHDEVTKYFDLKK